MRVFGIDLGRTERTSPRASRQARRHPTLSALRERGRTLHVSMEGNPGPGAAARSAIDAIASSPFYRTPKPAPYHTIPHAHEPIHGVGARGPLGRSVGSGADLGRWASDRAQPTEAETEAECARASVVLGAGASAYMAQRESERGDREAAAVLGAGARGYLEAKKRDGLAARPAAPPPWSGPALVVVAGAHKLEAGSDFFEAFVARTGGTALVGRDLLVAASHAGTKEGDAIAAAMQRGELLPDKTMLRLMVAAVKATPPPHVVLAEAVGGPAALRVLEGAADDRAFAVELGLRREHTLGGQAAADELLEGLRHSGRVVATLGDGTAAEYSTAAEYTVARRYEYEMVAGWVDEAEAALQGLGGFGA